LLSGTPRESQSLSTHKTDQIIINDVTKAIRAILETGDDYAIAFGNLRELILQGEYSEINDYAQSIIDDPGIVRATIDEINGN